LAEQLRTDEAESGPASNQTLQTLRRLTDFSGCFGDWSGCVKGSRQLLERPGFVPAAEGELANAIELFEARLENEQAKLGLTDAQTRQTLRRLTDLSGCAGDCPCWQRGFRAAPIRTGGFRHDSLKI